MYSAKVGSVCTLAYLASAFCSVWVAAVCISGGSKSDRKSSPWAAWMAAGPEAIRSPPPPVGRTVALRFTPCCSRAAARAKTVLGSVSATSPLTPALFMARATGATLVLPNGKLSLRYPVLMPCAPAETGRGSGRRR